MQFIIKKSLILFLLFISIILFHPIEVFASSNKSKIEDYGLISIMYHRFNESKYPSTNIQMDIFKKQIGIIEKEKIIFIHPLKMKENLISNKKQRKVLLTIDDGLLSFYENAWPFLKSKKIPFILFVNTRDVGKFNYMNWSQIKELSEENFVEIGNHSHSHEYLVDEHSSVIKKDITKSIKIFQENLNKNSK
ncbi:MAG: polysaccharide deacetylase, partial [Candidatus Pelagibacter sp.]|nr:polysaccharide deacetylase [Candidatus Pelagibacter sp.]